MTARESFAVLRESNFRWFFLARLVNLAGTMMAPVALAFAVLEVDDSASALGRVLAAHSIPMVVFLLIGGVIADRFDRATVIQGGEVSATFLVDGFVAGTWAFEDGRVRLTPFAPLPRARRREVEDEAARLEAYLRAHGRP